MPFPVLNACGVLDAKAAGEAAIKADAEAAGYSYTILRPGQLFGGPYDNNYYLGTLFDEMNEYCAPAHLADHILCAPTQPRNRSSRRTDGRFTSRPLGHARREAHRGVAPH